MSAPSSILPGDASASRSKKGILTPSTENTLNIGDNTTRTSKKRNWVNAELQCLPQDEFVIQPHPSLQSDKAICLSPRLLLPRYYLPLSYLDLIPMSMPNPSPRLFSAHIEALECIEPRDQDRALVMVSELESEGAYYAIERVRCGLYTLCKLGSWVNMKDLRASALIARSDGTTVKPNPPRPCGQTDWWNLAVIGPADAPREDVSKRLKTNDQLSIQLKMKPPISEVYPTTSKSRRLSAAMESDTIAGMPTLPFSTPADLQEAFEPNAQEIFKMLRSQYLDTLYLSKTSLAYFAKGPLSRARASFQAEHKTPLVMPELVDFLRSSIPSFVVLDSKYREAIPEIIQALPLGSLSDDEGNTVPLLNNKRKSRAKRIGKDGLYPWEDRSVAKWWRTRELDVHDGVSNEHREEEAKRLIKDLRTRETQLQLILVLEVLALEATLGATVAPHQPSGQAVEKPDEHTVKAKKRRPKRGQDLDLHLELLVDRLSIWQSVSLPDGSSRPSTSTGASKDRKSDRIGSKGAISTRGDEEDRLRDFCTEVIVPFYAARLPERCSSMNKKVGGIRPPSPPRLAPLQSATTSQDLLKPGTAINRHMALKPRRKMERVLTNDKLATQQAPPPLRRSATAPAVPGLKRESSEVSILEIPLKRAGVEKSKRYSQREVDLSAISHATELRLKKKAVVDEALRGAIATLKKPNRTLAVREFIDSVDHRVSGVGTGSRKSKNPVRNPFGQGVQVMATPKGNRKRNVFAKPHPVARGPSPEVEEASPPTVPSSDPRIPASVARSVLSPRRSSKEPCIPLSLPRPKRHNMLPAVMQTPTRGTSKLINVIADSKADPHEDELCQPSSPELLRLKTARASGKTSQPEIQRNLVYSPVAQTSQLQETPPRGAKAYQPKPCPSRGVSSTPMQDSKGGHIGSGATVDYIHGKTLQDPSRLAGSKSIYEDLGWDEDVDDLV